MRLPTPIRSQGGKVVLTRNHIKKSRADRESKQTMKRQREARYRARQCQLIEHVSPGDGANLCRLGNHESPAVQASTWMRNPPPDSPNGSEPAHRNWGRSR